MKKVAKWTAIVIGLLYLVACALLYVYQENFLFHPRQRTPDYSYGAYPEEWIEVEERVRLHAITVPASAGERAEQVILYLHGNVGDNGRGLYQSKQLQGLGPDLFLVDYRGFGKSEGTLGGEDNMTADFQYVYDLLVERYGEENIILTGYSMGTGPVSYLAANNDPRAVVLVSPYTSLRDMKNRFFWMVPDFLLNYELDSRKNLAAAEAPVTILHGTADRLIPFEMAGTLNAVDEDRITLIPLEGVSHRGAVLQPAFRTAVEKYVLAP